MTVYSLAVHCGMIDGKLIIYYCAILCYNTLIDFAFFAFTLSCILQFIEYSLVLIMFCVNA